MASHGCSSRRQAADPEDIISILVDGIEHGGRGVLAMAYAVAAEIPGATPAVLASSGWRVPAVRWRAPRVTRAAEPQRGEGLADAVWTSAHAQTQVVSIYAPDGIACDDDAAGSSVVRLADGFSLPSPRDVYLSGDVFVASCDSPSSIARLMRRAAARESDWMNADQLGMAAAAAVAIQSPLTPRVGAVLLSVAGAPILGAVNHLPDAAAEPSADVQMASLRRNALQELVCALATTGHVDEVACADALPAAFAKALETRHLLPSGVVHAEAALLHEAARAGIATDSTTLYVTKFPCHRCARDLALAGVRQGVFIEPSPNRLPARLYPGLVGITPGETHARLLLEHYHGTRVDQTHSSIGTAAGVARPAAHFRECHES
jgi:deoxycytidylate deaminase